MHTQTLVRKGRISILVGNPDFFRYSGRSLLKASPRPAAALSCVHLPPTSGLPFLSSSGSPEGSWQSKLATPGPSRPLHTTGLHPPQGLASLSADGPRLAPALLPHLSLLKCNLLNGTLVTASNQQSLPSICVPNSAFFLKKTYFI